MMVVTKVSCVCPTDINKRDHRQTTEGMKKKTRQKFQDIFAKELKPLSEQEASAK